MRSGNYDVSLIADSVVLDEMQVDGKTYVCSEPGKEYHVMISVYRDPVTKQFPCPYLRFGLYVDGIDVQYWKRLDLSNEHDLPSDPKVPVIVKFWGFKQNVSELRSFVFTTPSYDGDGTSTSSSSAAAAAPHVQQNAGRLKIVIYEARVTTGDFNNQQAAKQIQPATTFAAGNVKLLDQASMVTSTGQRIANEKEVFAPLQRWANVSTEPLQTIELHYHSRSMLRILANLTAQKNAQAGILNSGDDSMGDRSSRKRSLVDIESSSPKDEAVDGRGKERRLGAEFDPFTLNNGGGNNEGAVDADEDVVVVQKVIVAPLLDLTDDGDAPVWSSREIGS